MGSLRKQLLIAVVPLCALAAPAMATSAPPPIVELPPSEDTFPATGVFSEGSGWYLRGDIGYAMHKDPEVTFGPITVDNENWDETWLAGVGLGYRFSHNLRVDLTGEYRAASDISNVDSVGDIQRTELQSNVILLNAYYDIANLGGFTPYVGAGIGGAYHQLGRVVEVTSPGPVGFTFGDNKWALAAAAMAGVSYDVTNHLKLDANYRFLWMGDAHSSIVTDFGQNPWRIDYKDLAAHEIRIGMRYEFGGSGMMGY